MSVEKERLVEPRLLRGFRDYLPEHVIARQKMIATIKTVYERYGFVPLETPALEYTETLLGKYGDEGTKQIFRFIDLEGNDVAMRFDLTVPLARVVAQYPLLPRPFRRYQVGPVWRFDKPDPGRFREFIQFDLDTVGSASMAADAEIISGICDTMEALGIKRYRVRCSNRKILNSLIAFADIEPSRGSQVFRVLDKLDRIGPQGVWEELTTGRVDASGDVIPGLGFNVEAVTRIDQFLHLPAGTGAEILDAVSKLFTGVPGAEEGINELRSIDEYLAALGISEEKVVFDVTIARGLDYYTGPIFETILLDAPEFGSVFGGGRYDGLVERFLGEKIPATGGSFGVDRLLAALLKLEVVELKPSTAQVLVTVMDRSRLVDYQRVTRELRLAGINAELYLGEEKSIRKQLQYADRQKIPVAVIIGPDEFSRGEVSIKDLMEGIRRQHEVSGRSEWLKARFGQVTVAREKMLEVIREILDTEQGVIK
ncbi:MAG: histidine--tRNA ligase [Acidobacteria bacterium]|nr:histidine--tRNA ligase [Acidobacteriota bacterium]